MTVTEVRTKETQLQTKLADFAKSVPSLQFGTPEYDTAMGAYLDTKKALAGIEAEISAAVKSENSEKIDGAKNAYISAIEALSNQLKLSELLGEPFDRLVYFGAKAESAQGANDGRVASVSFNPTAKAKASGTKVSGAGNGKRPRFHSPDGTEDLNATAFVAAHGTEEQKGAKYPHTHAKALATSLGWSVVVPE